MKPYKNKKETQELEASESEITFLKKHLKKSKRNIILWVTVLFVIYSGLFALPDKNEVSLYNTYGLFNMLLGLFVVTGIIAFIAFKTLKIGELKKDVLEQKKLRQYGIVSRAGYHKGNYYLKLEAGNPRSITSKTQSFSSLSIGSEIRFEVFKNSKTFIKIYT